MKISIKSIIIFMFFFIYGACFAIDKENAQAYFPEYKIISGDSIFLYSTVSNGAIKYGYCYFDNDYTPLFSHKMTSFSMTEGERETYFNSNCYTVIPPLFEKAQPFSEGHGTICMNGKWAYISLNNSLATDFCFDAAMPIKNGMAQVMYNGKIESIKVEELSSYRTDVSNELQYEFKSKLIAQQFKESQCEKSLENCIEYIDSNRPSCDKDFSSSELFSLCLVCSNGKQAQDKLMATTMNHFHDLYNQYSCKYVDANLSFLHSSPVLSHLICQEIIQSSLCLYGDPELIKLKAYIEQKDYKRAVVGMESYYSKQDNIDYDSSLYTIYTLLLSLSNDFETLWSAVNNLTVSTNDITLDNIVRNGLTYRFRAAVELTNKALAKSNKKEIIYSLLASLYSYHGMNELKAKEYYSKIFHNSNNSEALISEAYSNYILIPSIDKDYAKTLESYYSHEGKFASNLFKHCNILELSKEWGLTKSRIDQVVDCLILRGDDHSTEMAYRLTLLSKNILTDEQLDWQQLAKFSQDSDIRKMFFEYDNLKSQYNGYNIFDLDNEPDSEVILKICNIESTIKNKLFPGRNDVPYSVDIDLLRKSLHNNAIAVEFTKFHINNIPWYGAFVISAHSTSPKFVKLINEYDLVQYKNIYRAKNTESIQNFYESSFGTIFWSKFDFKNYEQIYFATTGMIDEIGLEFLTYKNGHSLFEDYSTCRVKSTANIPHLDGSIISKDGYVALYGGLDYGVTAIDENRGSVVSGKLKYSGTEIDDIDKILSKSFQTKKYTAKEGTTNSFKELSNISPTILHFATHGYQRPNMHTKSYLSFENRFNYYRQNKDIEDEDWLLSNTGLRMSADTSITDSVNNLLLSREIANSRLQNTALVVLSACNTSDGNSSDSYDCILGLNYAFQKAKVKNIITSLWSVYDNTSYEFMKTFYAELVSSDIHDAFYHSVSKMKTKYPNNPEIWSSFVLIEN